MAIWSRRFSEKPFSWGSATYSPDHKYAKISGLQAETFEILLVFWKILNPCDLIWVYSSDISGEINTERNGFRRKFLHIWTQRIQPFRKIPASFCLETMRCYEIQQICCNPVPKKSSSLAHMELSAYFRLETDLEKPFHLMASHWLWLNLNA